MNLNSKVSILRLLLAVVAFFALFCSMGGSAEQGNARISGQVVQTRSGCPAIVVQLVKPEFNPFDGNNSVITTTTDAGGRYAFEVVSPGTYYLFAFSGGDRVFLDGPFTVDGNDSAVRNGLLAEASVITILGSAPGFDSSTGYYIKGSPRVELLRDNASNRILLYGVPAGIVDVMEYPVNDSTGRPQLYSEDVEVRPGDSLAVGRANRPPRTITETVQLPSTVYIDSTYIFPIRATDPDGDTVTYLLLTALHKWSIDTARGELAWTPAQSELALTRLVVKIGDQRGAFTMLRGDFRVMGRGAAPTPLPPEGVATCTPGTVAVFTAENAGYCSASARYRFAWGDGDTSAWAALPSIGHAWMREGSFSVRVQVDCGNYTAPSAWSEARSVVVGKAGVTGTPSIIASVDTVCLHDTLRDVAYDSAGDSLISAPGNVIPNDTVVLRASGVYCGGALLYRYYVNGSAVTEWTDEFRFTFRPQTDGRYALSVATWCDSATNYPSAPSAPCTVSVLPERFPEPEINGSFTTSMTETVDLKFSISSDSMFRSVPLRYRYQVVAKTENQAEIARLILTPCNAGEACTDSVKIKATDGPTGWYRGRLIYFTLFRPEKTSYSFCVQAGTTDGLWMSGWKYYPITFE